MKDNRRVPDWTRAARRPSDREEIVDHVLSSPPSEPEPDWLEWKTDYDLATVAGRVAVARQIIGFANRHPDRAGQHAEGLGYLVLGVEPQNLCGAAEHDAAELQNWLNPYVGDGIAWNPDYVHKGGQAVLFITVEAPRWGDPVHSLRKEGVDIDNRAVLEGTIWVRKLGKTDRAAAADVDFLSERARAAGRTLSFSLRCKQAALMPVGREVLSEGWREEVIRGLRHEYLSEVPDSPLGIAHIVGGDSRTPVQFQQEVDDWLRVLETHWGNHVAVAFIEEENGPLDLEIVNESDDVFESVQVEVTFPLESVWLFLSGAQARGRLRPPTPPTQWQKSRLSLRQNLEVPDLSAASGTEIEEVAEGKSTLVRFAPVLVRPRSTHSLTRLLLALPPALADQELPVVWRATSSSTSGELKGHLRLQIGADPADQAEAQRLA